MISDPLKNIGPGALITAAFIGPGTVTVCMLAGIQFGYDLLWALTLSVIATVVLQEMASRIGLVTGKGLSQVLKDSISNRIIKLLVTCLVLAAIVIGNAAYEAGNLSGALLGLQVFHDGSLSIENLQVNFWLILIGLTAAIILHLGNYKTLERLFMVLIALMSISFVITTIMTAPDLIAIARHLIVPKIPDQGLFLIIALIGTTVVPYNLFLHVSLVNHKWGGEDKLKYARADTIISVILGGIVSMCILIAATSIDNNNITSVSEMAISLEPLYGTLAKYAMALGLFAAGLTSSITAPLAAAIVVQGFFGFDKKSWKFRSVWLFVLISGLVFSGLGYKPIEVIKFAQVANGLLLPAIAIILIWLANEKMILGERANSHWQNLLSFFVLIITLLLGGMSIVKLF